jgi:hypothetical protein
MRDFVADIKIDPLHHILLEVSWHIISAEEITHGLKRAAFQSLCTFTYIQ